MDTDGEKASSADYADSSRNLFCENQRNLRMFLSVFICVHPWLKMFSRHNRLIFLPSVKYWFQLLTRINKDSSRMKNYIVVALSFVVVLLGAGWSRTPSVGGLETRTGDEIVVAGQFFHTGTRVVLWLDPGGYDGYRVERRFGPFAKSSWEISHAEDKNLTTPNRFGLRKANLTTNEIERVRGGGWDLPLLQTVVDQFVMHFDVCGTSENCFRVLQDDRDLSVHFLLDVDGTIYQTLDLKERAWHATTSNDRSIGVEIANIGDAPAHGKNPFGEWYANDADGKPFITIPQRFGDGGILTSNFVGRPARPELVRGTIQGQDLVQYDFTPQQYAALVRLTASVCKIFPKIQCRYPVDENGKLIPHKLPDEQLKNYEGLIGHYHIQTNKTDPGPAFNWDYVVTNAQKLIAGQPLTPPVMSPRAAGNLLK
jgi:N-acetylmuramoyl-L-alanine amidase